MGESFSPGGDRHRERDQKLEAQGEHEPPTGRCRRHPFAEPCAPELSARPSCPWRAARRELSIRGGVVEDVDILDLVDWEDHRVPSVGGEGRPLLADRMDPHKRSATIEVINEFGDILRTGKFGTDQVGYAEMLAAGRRFGDRVWAVEGCNGVGRHIAHRLVHDGEIVLDVPAKLSAQVRVFATGNGRKTDPVDAHSVALVALRTPNLVRVQADPELVVMGMLVDRRDELGRARTQTVNRLHRLLLELFPGGAKKFLSSAQARALVARIRPRDIVGKTRRRLAVELIIELEAIDKKIKPRRLSKL